MKYSIDEIEFVKALKTFFQPEDVFEIRVLDAVTAAYRKPHIESGYFDYDHIDTIPYQLKHIIQSKGVYCTVNPVKKDLLARAVNRMRVPGREPVTADGDVLTRRWLLIDCDAKRVSGVSSTEEEHSFALKKAQEIKAGFSSIDWPAPIEIDSGNGAQLMYRINLPCNDNNTIHNILKNIATVSDDNVDVDITVHNPARIWRVPGTWNCKGDSIDSRPHRISKVLRYPNELIVVPSDLLEKSAIIEEKNNQNFDYTYHEDKTFDLDNWINQHLPNLNSPKVWNGGRKWVFDVCPFNDSHTDKSAVLIQQANGAIAFKCHHNSCSGNDWHRLRELLEPNCYEPKIVEYPRIDLTEFLNSFTAKVKKKENPFESPGEIIPDKLLLVPGLVNEIKNISLQTAPYPNEILAFCAAISFIAHIAGRKFRDKRNNFTNLYLIALANSGSGKDHPRKVNVELANLVGLGHTMGDAFASGAGLEDSIYLSPSSLFQLDEIDWLFNILKGNSKDNSMSESINEKLLKFYGSSNSTYYMRKKAVNLKEQSSNIPSLIHNPCLNLYGTGVPSYFYESLSKRVLENGLIARCMIMEANKRGMGQDSTPIDKKITDRLLQDLRAITTLELPTDYLGKPTSFIEIPETLEATEKLRNYRLICDDNYNAFEKLKEQSAMAIWARVFEKVCKLSMVYAISENPREPLISAKGVDWAYSFVEYTTKLLLYKANLHCYESEADRKMKQILQILKENDGVEFTKRDLYRKLNIKKKEFEELEATLFEAERITKEVRGSKVVYVATC